MPPGRAQRADLPVAQLPTQDELSIPIEVVNGVEPGPKLWVNAAIHGDEINGVEIVRALLDELQPDQLAGALIAVPIVNVFGLVHGSRYLPDRRDLNRSFPGREDGSLAARLAHLFMVEIVDQCTHGIDLHTGSNERTNLPHLRADLSDERTRAFAEALGAPIMLDSSAPRGSLRSAVQRLKKPIVAFEAGESGRLEPKAVRIGLEGILRVMDYLGMREHADRPRNYTPREAGKKAWIRAGRAGILRLRRKAGDRVEEGDCLGTIGDAFDADLCEVCAPFDGIVLSHLNNPLVHQGDAVIHLASLKD